MGLDQYLNAKINLPVYECLRNELKNDKTKALSDLRKTIIETVGVKDGEQGWFGIATFPNTVTVCIQAAYWRKANQIHNWFGELSKENRGKDLDNCEEVEVTNNNIKDLVAVCQHVLDARNDAISAELLPTQGGFFYGSTDYDEYYYKELESTIEQLKPWLDLPYDVNFSYYGWW